MRSVVALLGLGGALVAVACSSNDVSPVASGDGRVCAPGAATICTCSDGAPGSKGCLDDGRGWGSCMCQPLIPVSRGGGSTNGQRTTGVRLHLQVFVTATGAPVASATVRAGGVEIGATDASGVLDALAPPGGEVALAVSAEGFVENVTRVSLEGATEVSATAELMPVGASVSLDSAVGGTVPHGGATVSIPGGSFVDALGSPVQGPVTVEMTYVAPGPDLQAIGSFGVSGQSDEILASLGLVAVRALSAGQPVNLAPGARLSMRIPSNGAPAGSPSPPLWQQNQSTGTWDRASNRWALDGTSWVAEVDGLATWNCDFPEKVTCLRGGLVGPNKKPLGGVVVSGLISGKAADFLPATTVQKATTGSDGRFCMEVVPEGQVDLSVTCPGGSKVALGSVIAPNLPGTRCSGSQCPELGTFSACCFKDSDCNQGESCTQGVCQSNRCDSSQTAGGDTPETRKIDLGKTSGTFTFSWDMLSVKDQMKVLYDGKELIDTGCVSGAGSMDLQYAGADTLVTVEVIPNCEGGTSGTQWSFVVSCPK